MFNFSATESAKQNSYLKPGVYRFKITEVTLEKAKNTDTKFLKVTFSTKEKQTLSENFMLTEKALGRLQYLHEAWTGSKCDKSFKSVEAVQEYFSKTLANTKLAAKNVLVHGRQVDDNVYAELPYTEFVVGEDAELGEFEEGSKEYKAAVKKGTAAKNESTGKKGGVLNDVDDDDDDDDKSDSKDDDGEDEPW
jgi:hypothetical protein